MNPRNKNSPFFYIIVTSYNRADLLSRAINSVLQQDIPDWQVCIVDDGSNQATLDALRPFETIDNRVVVYYLPKNQGVNFARNYALNRIQNYKTQGFVTFLDDDDLLIEQALSIFKSKIQKYPDEGWFVANCETLTGRRLTKIKTYGKGNYIDDYMFSSRLRGDAMHMISLEAIGNNRFSNHFKNSEEWIWFLQIAKNIDFYAFNQSLKRVDYQESGLSTLKVNQGNRLNVFKVKETLCLDLKPAYLAEQRMLLAREYFRDGQIELGMSKLRQAFAHQWWKAKWYQILVFGLYRSVSNE